MANQLYDIPGLGGFLAAQDRRRAAGQQDMENNIQQMKLADILNAQQDEQQLKQVMGQTGGDPTKAIQALLAAGTPKSIELASKLDGLIKKPKWNVTERYNEKTGMPEKILINENDPTQIQPFGGQKSTKASEHNVTPYFQFLPAEGGYAIGNARTGQIAPGQVDGKPVIPAQYAPGLKRELSAAAEEGKAIGEQRGMIPNKQDALSSVNNALGILDKGIYTGAYAGIKKAGAKYTPFVDTAKASRTEEFISEIGNTIVPRLKEFGGNDSNEELRYLQRISGGDITLEEGALRNVLNRAQIKIQRGIDRARKGLDPNGVPMQQTQPNVGGVKFLGFE